MPPRTKGFPPHTGSGPQVPRHRPPAAARSFSHLLADTSQVTPHLGRGPPGRRPAPTPNAQCPGLTAVMAAGLRQEWDPSAVGSYPSALPREAPTTSPSALHRDPCLRLCLRCPDPGRRRPRACDSASLVVRGLALCLMTWVLLPDVLTGANPTVLWSSSRRFVRAQSAALISTICLSH